MYQTYKSEEGIQENVYLVKALLQWVRELTRQFGASTYKNRFTYVKVGMHRITNFGRFTARTLKYKFLIFGRQT